MAFVERKGGPHGLVPGWLEQHQLWRYLRRDVEGGGRERKAMTAVHERSPKQQVTLFGVDVFVSLLQSCREMDRDRCCSSVWRFWGIG